MKTTLISHDDFKTKPWKNGQGVTAQIEVYPPTADFSKNSFDWRISQAQISATNSFSLFPGFDRCLFVLSGAGIKLTNNRLGPKNLTKKQIYHFHGEDRIECSLIDDSVEDLGVIFKRDSYMCEMRIENLESAKKLNLNNGIHFIKPLNQTLIATSKIIEPKNILRVEGSGELMLQGESPTCLALLISIFKK